MTRVGGRTSSPHACTGLIDGCLMDRQRHALANRVADHRSMPRFLAGAEGEEQPHDGDRQPVLPIETCGVVSAWSLLC